MKNNSKKIGKKSDVATEKSHIQNLIQWETSSNLFIEAMAALFTDGGPKDVICVTDTIASVYGMPDKGNEVYNIIDNFRPSSNSAVGLTFASELAEREIFELHLKTVDPKDTCKIQLTESALLDTLINCSIIERIINKMSSMKFYHSEIAFEHNCNTGNLFGSDLAYNFLFSLLGIETTGMDGRSPIVDAYENCHNYIFDAGCSLAKIEDMTERKAAAEKWVKDIQRVIKTLTARLSN